jgi:hypothetical protein
VSQAGQWLVIAMVAVGAVGATVAQTQEQRPDLAVVSLRVLDPAPSWIEGQAKGSSIEVLVANRGNVPVVGYQLRYTWIGGSGEGPLNEDTARSMDVREETLEPRTERTLTFPWRLQPGQAGQGAVKVVVQLTAVGATDANPTDNARVTDTMMVPVRAMQVAALGGPQLVRPGEVVFVRFQILNLGNVPESVILSAPAPSPGAASRLDSQLEVSQLVIPANGAGTATLFIHYPDQNDPTSFSAQLPFKTTTSYGRVIDVLTPLVSSTDEDMPLQSYGQTLSVTSSGTRFADPGSHATLHLIATNTGKEKDTYTLDAEAAPEWALDIQPRRIALLPGESTSVTVTATPASTLAGGTGTVAVVNLRSEHPLPPVSATALLRVSGPVPGVFAAPPESAYVGDAWTLSVRAQNEGNVAIGGDGSLEVRTFFSDGSTRVVTTTMGPLQAGGKQQVTVPFGGLLQGGPATYSLQWRAPGGISSPVHEGGFVIHDPRINITSPTPLGGMPGESVSYRVAPHVFHLRNDGATAETVHVAVEAAVGRAAVLGPTALHLAPGETRAVAVEHVLSRPALGGLEEALRLKVNIADRPEIAWNATVLTKIIDVQAPTIRVDLRPADWALATPLPVAATVQDDGMVAGVLVRVNAPDNTTRNIPLVSDNLGVWRTNVRFNVTGNHSLTLHAADAAGNAVDGPTWPVTVHATPVPRITPDLPSSGMWDINHPLKVAVVSTVGASVLNYVLTQENATVSQGGVPIVEGNASIALRDARPGMAELRLTVIDSAGTQSTTTLALNLTTSQTTEVLDEETATEPLKETAPSGLWPVLLGVALTVFLRRRRP